MDTNIAKVLYQSYFLSLYIYFNLEAELYGVQILAFSTKSTRSLLIQLTNLLIILKEIEISLDFRL